MTDRTLTIDIPVTLAQVRSVHSIGTLELEGDLPAAIFHLQLIARDIADSTRWREPSSSSSRAS